MHSKTFQHVIDRSVRGSCFERKEKEEEEGEAGVPIDLESLPGSASGILCLRLRSGKKREGRRKEGRGNPKPQICILSQHLVRPWAYRFFIKKGGENAKVPETSASVNLLFAEGSDPELSPKKKQKKEEWG